MVVAALLEGLQALTPDRKSTAQAVRWLRPSLLTSSFRRGE
jgi:hypothetical protein